jgi:hypothetical protein
MALNAAVIMPPLQQVIFDKTLDTFLSDGKVYFYEDANRTVPKEVYELTGTGPGSYTYTSLGTQLTLSGIGSFVDNLGNNIAIYLWPFTGSPNDMPPSQTVQNYYITVYSSTGVFQFDIPNWPGIEFPEIPTSMYETTDNILSNPEFVDILFLATATQASPAVFNTTGTNTATLIAPDWAVVTTGSGSFSVFQQQVTDSTFPGNPAYALGITSASYGQPIQLRQRIYDPRLFVGQFVSATFVAGSLDGGAHVVSLTYTPSITGTIQTICTGTTLDSGYTVIADTMPEEITNPGDGTGYVDISIVIPVGASLIISCVQLCGVVNNEEVVAYLEQTPERQIDHLFHYFQPQLNYKPLRSCLVGWDFPLNPQQFGTSGSLGTIGANKGAYVWDQTIVYQTVNNSVSYNADSSGDLLLTMTANGQVALIQYLEAFQIQSFLRHNLSVNIVGAITTATPLTISLWYTTNGSLPNIATGTNNTLVTALDANGHPSSVVGGWTELARGLLGNATYTPSTSINIASAATMGFSGWNALTNTVAATATYFAIVIGTGTMPNGQSMQISSVSLVQGDIPTIPSIQTVDEVLRDCEFYYEVSDVNGAVILMNSLQQIATNQVNSFASPFEIVYRVPKRIAPLVYFFSLSFTLGDVSTSLYYSAITTHDFTIIGPNDVTYSSYWNTPVIGTKSLYALPKSATSLLSNTGGSTGDAGFVYSSADIQFFYNLDARLGLV